MTSEPSVNLANCDREAIQIPGSIQPHGCLLACDASVSIVMRHSANAADMLGATAELKGQRLEAVLGNDALHAIRNSLARTKDASRSALTFDLRLASGQSFDVSAHIFKGVAIIEFDPSGAGVAEPIELARTVIAQIKEINQAGKLYHDASRLVRAMLGYDRVMIYQLGSDGAGKVIAEAKRSDLESFKGQYFPASDIPQQARALYLRNPIRIIPNSRFQPVPIEPVLDLSGEPLDLSYAHLRSVSPIHCEYLCNMGVSASMSISIIVNGALWGLIACHHYEPRILTTSQRVAAEIFGDFLSLHISTLLALQTLEAAAHARQVLDTLLRDSNRSLDIEQLLRTRLSDFKALITCDGIGMSLQGHWVDEGLTPPKDNVTALLQFAQEVTEGQTWASNRLSMAHPLAADYANDVSGMLIIPMSQRPKDFLMLFRQEVVETLDWAGDPNKTYESGALGERLSPRKSSAVWKETVHQQSLPWTEQDRQFGEAIRTAVVEVVLHNSELLNSERSKADVRQRMLNEELNHRVKNILALIGALVSHPTAESQTLNGYVETVKGRIHALSLAHDQVVRGDGGGSLFELLSAELSPYRSVDEATALMGPNVILDARAYSVLALVLHELATNAAKYGALSTPEGKLSVIWTIDAVGACDITWRESGGPLVRPPSRQGFGSVLIGRSIPFDLGGTSVIEYKPEGVQGVLRIPANHCSVAEPVETQHSLPIIALPYKEIVPLTATCVMILEDQLVIAVGLEQILMDAGVRNVITAGSEAEALRLLVSHKPDVAVLDINLGDGTSIVVADELTRLEIPFLFATGYGDSIIIPGHLKHVPVLRKPYDAHSMLLHLEHLIDPSS
jgi:light-regulated signal transduction histidine kinase (bacteriophytochrome)